MTVPDDPEQRIRDLERRLSDRATELGVGPAGPVPQYVPPRDPFPPPPSASAGYPPPLPPPGAYSTPGFTFGTPFERQSPSAFRVGWLLLAIPVIGIVIAGGAFAYFLLGAAHDVTGEFGSMKSESPSFGSPAPSTGVPTAAAGATIGVSGVSTRESVACAGGTVNVSGVKNTVEVTGRCASVVVSGVENVVVVEFADAISASGFTNRVTYRSGTPAITAIGDNVIAPA